MNLDEYAKLKADNIIMWYDGPMTYFTKQVGDSIVFANAVIECWDSEFGYDGVLFIFSVINLNLYRSVQELKISLRDALLDDSVVHLAGFPGENDGKIVGLYTKEELLEVNWLPTEDISIDF